MSTGNMLENENELTTLNISFMCIENTYHILSYNENY